ncbi:MAG: hypothetical protein SOR94_07720 [Lawsonella sp.]|uniref:hypothetical protein n=1 Tax=Lawsonella sp. TaxID=2041415 RepID=UPI002A76385E|nr:hypothetical protein [Lawsonella sp.]MDY2979899.1 hypothetical protein [Lawsonella sp.]
MIGNLVIGVISGVISGLIVSFSLWLWNYWRKPPLELVHITKNRAVLKNNRLRAVVIGGTWEMGNGSVLYRADGFRGGEGGFYIKKFGEFVVGTTYFLPGQTADIVYKYIKNEKDPAKVIQIEHSNVANASEIALNQDQYPAWKVARVTLKGVS